MASNCIQKANKIFNILQGRPPESTRLTQEYENLPPLSSSEQNPAQATVG